MINFYLRFLRNTAQVLAPLTNALKGPGKSLLWSDMLDSAFCHDKLLLASVPVLTHTEPNDSMSLAVDASESHVGAVLLQMILCCWSQLAFF